MKALSLRQPWAAAVLHLGKSIENRRWSTNFRGEFLIHAAKGMTRGDEYEDAVDFCAVALQRHSILVDAAHQKRVESVLRKDSLLFGGIVGRARIVSVIPPCRNVKTPTMFHTPCDHQWHIPEQYGFVLKDIRPTTFVPWPGALGFFDVPDDVVAKAVDPVDQALECAPPRAVPLTPEQQDEFARGAADVDAGRVAELGNLLMESGAVAYLHSPGCGTWSGQPCNMYCGDRARGLPIVYDAETKPPFGPGDLVWYQPSDPGRWFAGVVRSDPWLLGGPIIHEWVMHLGDMETDYRKANRSNTGPGTVAAAAVGHCVHRGANTAPPPMDVKRGGRR